MNPLLLRLLPPMALLIVLSGCNSKADTATEVALPRPVLAATVEAVGTQQSTCTGVVAARTESELGLRVGGKVITTDVRVDHGPVVGEGQSVARLAHDGAREVIVNLPENSRNRAAQKALAFPSGAPEQAVTATLRELSTSADPATHTYRARYVLHGAVGRFALGSTITVRLPPAQELALNREQAP